MIRHTINGQSLVETIKPVVAGDEGMIYARFFLPCHCVREEVMDKGFGANPALVNQAREDGLGPSGFGRGEGK